MDIIKSDLFLAPLFCVVREPVDAVYNFEQGTAILTLYYKPVKYVVPDVEVLDGFAKELRDLPVEISERRDGDKLTMELSDVDRLGDRLTITRKVVVELDYAKLSVLFYTQISFAHKVV